MSKSLTLAADVLGAVSLISKAVQDGKQIMKLFSQEDLTEQEVEAILNQKRSNIESRIEGEK